MRNPIRVKNLRLRFLPFYLLGLALLFTVRPAQVDYVAAAVVVLAGASLRTWAEQLYLYQFSFDLLLEI